MEKINKNHLNNPVVIILVIAFLGLGGYMLFSKTSTIPENKKNNDVAITTLYTNTTANVRSCASTSCKIIGTYELNYSFDLTESPYEGITDISQLPDWMVLDFSDGTVGYIRKTVLSIHKTEVQLSSHSVVTTTKATDLPTIVKEWSPRVVRIVCSDSNYISSGTGVLTRMDFSSLGKPDAPTLITNKHVVTNPFNGLQYTYCNFAVPGISQYITMNMSIEQDATDEDVAYFPSSAENPPPGAKTAMKVCNYAEAKLGDKIAILGYPASGGTGEATTAITVTEGLISSYDGEFYVTDAKIDHGNSGGAAILVKSDCYLGIPTWAEAGSFESYGRILSAKYIFGD
jgi:hypothetical protein